MMAMKKSETVVTHALTSVMVTDGEAQDSQPRRSLEAQDAPAAGLASAQADEIEPVLSESAQMNAIQDEQHTHKDNDELLNARCKSLANTEESQQTNNQAATVLGKEAKVEDSLR